MHAAIKALRDAAEIIAGEADALEASLADLSVPQQEYTIAEAYTALRAATGPDAFVVIQPPSFNWNTNTCTLSEWVVYDGDTHSRSPSLAGAVNLALARLSAQNAAPESAEAIASLVGAGGYNQ